MNVSAVRKRLEKACEAAGGQRAWAKLNGVAASAPSIVILGRINPPPAILAALGLERVVDYRVKRR